MPSTQTRSSKKYFAVFRVAVICCLLAACRRTEYTSGEAVYAGKCAKCHKLQGSGGEKGPDLTDILSRKDEEYVRIVTVDPRSVKADGTMPPSKLSDRELDLLIQYLKEQNRPAANAEK